jgi:hypothetical protein
MEKNPTEIATHLRQCSEKGSRYFRTAQFISFSPRSVLQIPPTRHSSLPQQNIFVFLVWVVARRLSHSPPVSFMMRFIICALFLCVAVVCGQQAGNLKTEGAPAIPIATCVGSGGGNCPTQNLNIVLDANWRYVFINYFYYIHTNFPFYYFILGGCTTKAARTVTLEINGIKVFALLIQVHAVCLINFISILFSSPPAPSLLPPPSISSCILQSQKLLLGTSAIERLHWHIWYHKQQWRIISATRHRF